MAILALEAGLPGEPIPQRPTAAESPMNRLYTRDFQGFEVELLNPFEAG